jgi:hypothetical protein
MSRVSGLTLLEYIREVETRGPIIARHVETRRETKPSAPR